LDRYFLNGFHQYIQPPGITIPGYLPQQRLMPWPNILVQQHEGLHWEFNVATSLGNAITILNLLGRAIPNHEVGQAASLVAASWYEALAEPLEGVICYVSYRRAVRRDKSLLSVENYEKLMPEYTESWRIFRSVYDYLPLSDYSRDALAMIVAKIAFNLPIYSLISNLKHLQNVQNQVSRQLIHDRLEAYHKVISSQSGNDFCRKYDEGCIEIYKSSGNLEEKQSNEFKIVYDYLSACCPEIPSAPLGYTPNSINVIKDWEQQYKDIGIVPTPEISIQLVGDMKMGENQVTVIPPSPRIGNLYPLSTINEAFIPLEASNSLWCIGFLYEHKGQPFVLSQKYNRILNKGECYIRFHYAESDSQNNIVRQIEIARFAITSREKLIESLASCSQHPRVILASTMTSEELLDNCSISGIGHKFACWRIKWNLSPQLAVEYIKSQMHRLSDVLLINDIDPAILYVLAIAYDTKQRIVIPLVTSACEEKSEMLLSILTKPPTLIKIPYEELLVGITMAKSCAF
jgi:predicted DNA-binding protein YlxM (UPF0122 family)